MVNDEDDFSEGAEAEVVDEGRVLSNLFYASLEFWLTYE